MTTSATIPNAGAQSSANPLKGLLEFGQSPWMDYIRRDLLTSGELKRMIGDDGLRGMTSNPSISKNPLPAAPCTPTSSPLPTPRP